MATTNQTRSAVTESGAGVGGSKGVAKKKQTIGQKDSQQKAGAKQTPPAVASSGDVTGVPTGSAQNKQMMVCRYSDAQYLVIPVDQRCPSRP